jgi:hypothetical protein
VDRRTLRRYADGRGVHLDRGATRTGEASQQDTWSETLDFVLEAEKLGLDICWVAEA